jgi:hypothetical protein
MFEGVTKRLPKWPWAGIVLSAVYLATVFALPCLPSSVLDNSGYGNLYVRETQNPLVNHLGSVAPSARADTASAQRQSRQSINDCITCRIWVAFGRFVSDLGEPVGLFTGLLVIVSAWQGYLILRAERLTRESLYISQQQFIEGKKDSANRALAEERANNAADLSAFAAQKAANAAIAARRPWIKIEIQIASDLTDDGHGVRLAFKMNLRNIGATPATNLQPWVPMALGVNGFKDALAKLPYDGDDYGFSLFPNEQAKRELWGRIEPEEIERALTPPVLASLATKGIKQVSVAIVASVTYQFAGGGRGQTTKAYRLVGPGFGDNFVQVVDLGKLPVPQSKLTLTEIASHDTVI